MFAQCIIAAQLIDIGNGVKCAGAMQRDALSYAFSISVVLLAFAIGTLNKFFVGVSLAIYACYAVWVFLGDEWHASGRPDARTTVAAAQASLYGVRASLANFKDAVTRW